MPPLEMRGRYIQREFWGDTDLHTKATADVREFYIGLWMLADDKGWMPRDIVGIGAALYRFEGPDEREAHVRANLDRLQTLGKVRSHRCKCLFMPAVARYPRAGKPNDSHFKAHQTHSNAVSNRSSDIQKDLNPSPVPSLPDPSPRAHAPAKRGARMESVSDVLTDFQQRVPRPA